VHLVGLATRSPKTVSPGFAGRNFLMSRIDRFTPAGRGHKMLVVRYDLPQTEGIAHHQSAKG
jgi:hypothetical protein